MVGLMPLFAVATIEPHILDAMPAFRKRMRWFIDNRPDLTENINCARRPGLGERFLLAIAYRDRLERVLKIMLDESEFLSPYGIRALSRYHKDAPYILHVGIAWFFCYYHRVIWKLSVATKRHLEPPSILFLLPSE